MHEDYAAIDAINWSSLKMLKESPLMYHWRKTHPAPSSPAMTLGSAVHCAVLEPNKFVEQYAVYDGPVRRGKAWDKFVEEHADSEILTKDEYDTAARIGDAVLSSEARELLRGGSAEIVQTWIDEATGVPCKGRLDYVAPGTIVDLKTARDIDPRRFPRAAARLLYHGQLAFYHDGAIPVGGPLDVYIIAVQNHEPWDVAIYQLTWETLEYGRALYRRLLHTLLACQASDFWPGCCPTIRPLELPMWAEEDHHE